MPRDEARRSRRYRKRKNDLPLEIETSNDDDYNNMRNSNSDDDSSNDSGRSPSWMQRSPQKSQVQIRPGSELIPSSEPWRIPPEPTDEPPIPSQILRFTILGAPKSGKTSIADRFVHRRYATPPRHDGSPKELRKMSSQKSEWTVDYSKKDVAFWDSENVVECVRVQVWDVNGQDPCYNGKLERSQEFQELLEKSHTIFLTSSMETDDLLQELGDWKTWLDSFGFEKDVPIVLLLTKSDILIENCCNNTSPVELVRAGAKLESCCAKLGFRDWFMTSCRSDTSCHSSSIEDIMMKTIRNIVPGNIAKESREISSFAPTQLHRGDTTYDHHPIVEAKVVPI